MLTEIPYTSKEKRKEWQKRSIIFGAVGGLNAVVWGLLLNYWIGLV